ncbi:MAG: tetratricopeptide repeat protein, partial [Spirochaetota bacterium]
MDRKFISMAFVLAFSATTALHGQWKTELNSPGAEEQMRLGVIAYHQGRYSQALLFFEKSLAYDPGEELTLYWLGLCYLRSGYEATALRTLEPLLDHPSAPPQLHSLVESLRSRRSLGMASMVPRYVEAARIEGTKGKSASFSRPTSIVPQSDGTFMLVAQGSSQILRIDPNGLVKERISGGLAGFDRPFGLVGTPDGVFFVSEFNGDRITRIQGGQANIFGTNGRGDGQLIGPQFMTIDDSGYIYVCDYGNSRIAKFDSEGNFILAFGSKTGNFSGLESPAGMAYISNTLYVADSYTKSIYCFDSSGNYLNVVAAGLLHFPEGLAVWNSGNALLVADTDRVISVDLKSERVDEIYRSPDSRPRIVCAVADYNGNILISDFDASVVSILTEGPSIAQGYQVAIDRIDAAQFPKVRLSVTVRDRNAQPVVGLSASNFYLSEQLRTRKNVTKDEKTEIVMAQSIAPASSVVFEGSGTASQDFRAVILVDRSKAMEPFADAVRSSLVELGSAIGGRGAIGLVLANKSPVLAFKTTLNPDLRAMVKALQGSGLEESRIDLGIRQAANTLLPGEIRDSVVFFTNGSIAAGSFLGTSISELGSLLGNNGIRFYAVVFGDGAVDPALRYLTQKTGGEILAASRPR